MAKIIRENIIVYFNPNRKKNGVLLQIEAVAYQLAHYTVQIRLHSGDSGKEISP